MLIHFGADHGGYNLKESLKSFVGDKGYEIVDAGNTTYDESDDYPDFAAAVAGEVSEDPDHRRGIVICKSGVGVDIVANKFRGVRSVLGMSPDHVFAARNDDDVNVLSLAAEFATPEDAENMVKIFLATPFDTAERRVRRLDKIKEIDTRCTK